MLALYGAADTHPAPPAGLLVYRNYVSKNDALAQNLTYASENTLIIRADDKNVLDPSGPGRNSVRLYSNKEYKNHVTVCVPPVDSSHDSTADDMFTSRWNIMHMPEGCG